MCGKEIYYIAPFVFKLLTSNAESFDSSNCLIASCFSLLMRLILKFSIKILRKPKKCSFCCFWFTRNGTNGFLLHWKRRWAECFLKYGVVNDRWCDASYRLRRLWTHPLFGTREVETAHYIKEQHGEGANKYTSNAFFITRMYDGCTLRWKD